MADTKISSLASASALSGSEVLPGVQGGSTVGITVTQIAVGAVVANGASQSNMEAESSTTIAVPSTMKYHPGVAKVWLKCGVSADITSSYNVTSLSDGGAGIVTVTIDVDFSSANWCCVTGGLGGGTAVTNAALVSASSQNAGSVILSNYDASATPVLEDPTGGYFFFAGFGDQ